VETGLERADLESLLGVVAALAAVRPLAELRDDTVAVLPSLVEADHSAWNELDPETGRLEASLPSEFERRFDARMADLKDAFAAHVEDHPVIAFYRRTGNGQPSAISDFVSVEDFHRTALYRTFYAVIGTEDQLSFVLPAPEVTIGITLDRPDRGFSRRDREVLNFLRPHLVQAYRNAVALEAAVAMTEAVDVLAEDSGQGVLVVDSAGKVQHITSAARRILNRVYPDYPAGHLPDPLADYAASTASERAPAWPMVRDGLVVRRLSRTGVTVLVLDSPEGRLAPNALRQLGLTSREAEVLMCIIQGASTKQAATRLHISPRTVDKHIERALTKLGVDSRIAAANLVNQIAPPPSHRT
jgi:DNA-binding CsgD family transcriptional regulator